MRTNRMMIRYRCSERGDSIYRYFAFDDVCPTDDSVERSCTISVARWETDHVAPGYAFEGTAGVRVFEDLAEKREMQLARINWRLPGIELKLGNAVLSVCFVEFY